MTHESLVWGEDLPRWVLLAAVVLVVAQLLRAVGAARRETRLRIWLALTQVLSGLCLLLAIMRPSWVTSTTVSVGARVAVLVDGSRRLLAGPSGATRAQSASLVQRDLAAHFEGSRVAFFEFGRGELRPFPSREGRGHRPLPGETTGQSDLTYALERLEEVLGEKPTTVVVVSDGRLSRPEAMADDSAFVVPTALRGTVVHAVDVGGSAPNDASIVSIQSSGTAVAHQPFSLDVVVGCFGGVTCSRVPLTVREYRKGSPPTIVASGEAVWTSGETARVSLELTIERAGSRVLEVAIVAPGGDEVPENDSRMITIQVARDRLRLLHVAGRPTYDVRAMRNWLKSDSSVDLVSFFILRTDGDETNSIEDSELALIPFPVDELFDEHLSSFDAVLLGDIDAERYRVSRYFENLARFVENGGGLVLIGGPSAFAGGGYAESPLMRVLPVSLTHSDHPFDTVEFAPRPTNAGKVATMLSPLRALMGDGIPQMPGANNLGMARDRAVVLWEHPNRNALPLKTGSVPRAMPLLAVSEVGDGRVVALGVDGSHRLAFGPDAVRAAGRAYGALWDGLLGWVIRDPRFESTHGEIIGECLASTPVYAQVTLGERNSGELSVEVERLDGKSERPVIRTVAVAAQASIDIELGSFLVGAYSATLRLSDETPARFDFACESGGTAWADTRPDPRRLARLAKANGGTVVGASSVRELPRPPPTLLHGSRHARSLLSPWIWAFLAASCLVCTWLLRRMDGLA